MKRQPRLQWRCRWAALLAVCVLAASVAQACTVPVFRFALERWAPDPYQVRVFYRGEPSPEVQQIAQALGENRPGHQQFANVQLELIDLDGDVDDAVRAHWEAQETDQLPWLVARYPLRSGIPSDVWAGPATASSVELLVDSPARREIARRLLKGETAVWLFLETGDREKDEPAFELLTKRLAELEQSIRLQEIDEADIAEGLLSADPTELKVKFSTLRISRGDPAEQVLVQMLLHSEDHYAVPGDEEALTDLDEPMAFPAFGRGRVLYALVGAGINDDTLARAGADLTGPCTCTVKEQNPGVDLLMTVDWDGLLELPDTVDQELPPLAGVFGFGPEGTREMQSAAADDLESPVAERATMAAAVQAEPAGRSILWGSLAVAGLALGAVVIASVSMLSRRN